MPTALQPAPARRRPAAPPGAGWSAARLTVAATAAALALVTTGCGSDAGAGTEAALAGAGAAAPAAPSGCRPYDGPGLPLAKDAEPSAVERCVTRVETVPGDGAWSFEIHERATDLEPLVAALRLPSDDRSYGACVPELKEPGVVLLEIDGTTVPIVTPKDGCGQPRAEVLQAWQRLHWTETARSRLGRAPTP